MKTKVQTQRRRLQAHENLILQVIKRQAGTLSKAVLEGVMNAIDAGAQNISVTVGTSTVTISDDGRGFESEESIKQVFEVFGQPHDLDEGGISKDAKFGTFRIGRGQLFAFGVNTWRSNGFQMMTDINAWELEYNLTTDLPVQPGCMITVKLYEHLDQRSVQNTVDEITRFCRYVPQNLVVNGELIARDPAKMKWDVETDEAYINKKVAASRWRSASGLDVYQQGVFVETLPASEYGLEGTIVIKRAVQVNFARNQVIRSCKRWQKIARLLRATGIEDAAKRPNLTKDTARHFVESIVAGDASREQFYNTPCLPDVNGRLWSLAQLYRLTRSRTASAAVHCNAEGKLQIDFGPAGCRTGDKVMQTKEALVLDEVLLEYLRVAGPQTGVEWLELHGAGCLQWVDYRALLNGDDSYQLLPVQQLTMRERDFLQCASCVWWRLGAREDYSRLRRRLCVGISTAADGWTDGQSFIAVNRKWLAGLDLGLERDWNAVALLLSHELCHDGPDTDTHNHTPEFYASYHDMSLKAPKAARFAYQKHRLMVARRAGKLPKTQRNRLLAEVEAQVQTALVYDPPKEEGEP